ncbi:acyl-[acyl-carrier-protein] desaturase 4, chloroplastic-like [Phragmites australis]|uniref:acyl-[acyl-carrier-protein] desaturase 4, chloroplastic-like n=1 Tax=Phragmites australis TaxID=29695 RepID=UPI002D779572|nr:acyl-[acyl-carrier-protein] desaturase 4, chloroplastic-like [Phragmites australis]
MATQGLTTVATVKLCSLDRRNTSSARLGGLRLLYPAYPSVHALRACASGCSSIGGAGRWTAATTAASASVAAPGGRGGVEMERPPVPREQVEIIRSLNGWVAENMLPLLSPVESAWQPHDYLPRSSAEPGSSEAEAFDAFTEGVADLRAGAACLPDDVLVCLVGNMVTEEALPTYQSMGNRTEGSGDETGSSTLPWARWLRGWTAEENRHGDLLNRYLYLTGRVDMRQVETTIHHLLRNGMEMLVPKSPYHSLIYGAFQERATFISHSHTARLAGQHGDRALAKICGVITADERRHEAGYTKACAKLFYLDPDGMMRALGYVMRGKVTMPGQLMSDGRADVDTLFARFSAVAQRVGVYTASDYGDLVEHFVHRWRVAELTGLSSEGRREQEYVCGLAPKIRRMEELAHRRAARSEPSLVRFSWIFDRSVLG